MTTENPLRQEQLLLNIYQGDPVDIRFFDTSDPANQFLETAVRNLLEHYRKSDLSDSLHFYVKTLVTNAFQGNIRHAFFRRQNVDVNNIGQYVSALIKYNSLSGPEEVNLETLKNMDLWIRFVAHHSPDGICLEIFNNAPLPQVEEQKLRVKLQKSMLYNSMVRYYDAQSAGLDFGDPGIGVIAILMQRSNLDARLFRVGVRDGVTFSRIEIPFTALYQPKRQLVKA